MTDTEPIPTFTLKLTVNVVNANPSLWSSFKKLKMHEVIIESILVGDTFDKLNVHLVGVLTRLVKAPEECGEEINKLFDVDLPQKVPLMLQYVQNNQLKNIVEGVLEL